MHLVRLNIHPVVLLKYDPSSLQLHSPKDLYWSLTSTAIGLSTSSSLVNTEVEFYCSQNDRTCCYTYLEEPGFHLMNFAKELSVGLRCDFSQAVSASAPEESPRLLSVCRQLVEDLMVRL